MEESKSKKKRRTEKASLDVIGQFAMPTRILPWERDLLAVLLIAVNGSTPQEEKADAGVPS